MADLKARFVSAENSYLAVAFRRDVLEEVLRHYETYGVLWTWDYDSTDVSSARVDDSTGVVPLAHRIKPHYDWIEQTYRRIRPAFKSNKQARARVAELFGEEFADRHRNHYGAYDPPSDSTIRRALGEID